MTDEPNPPVWPDNDLIFSPKDDVSETKERIKVTEGTREFYQVMVGEELKPIYNAGKGKMMVLPIDLVS